ncbi:hypothetical protein LZ30DRAFT_787432 [Colletotrichum cereale]|nr:hypothetical protein LZ30DRAFT_787432 [Colletotrichum cereale]
MIGKLWVTTTTLQPEGYKEPAVTYPPPAGGSGITIGRVPDHTKMGSLSIASHKTFGNHDRVGREMARDDREQPHNKLERPQLIVALGFGLRKEGARLEVHYRVDRRDPGPATARVEAEHPRTDTRSSWRQQSNEFLNVNEATTGAQYQFTGGGCRGGEERTRIDSAAGRPPASAPVGLCFCRAAARL